MKITRISDYWSQAFFSFKYDSHEKVRQTEDKDTERLQQRLHLDASAHWRHYSRQRNLPRENTRQGAILRLFEMIVYSILGASGSYLHLLLKL